MHIRVNPHARWLGLFKGCGSALNPYEFGQLQQRDRVAAIATLRKHDCAPLSATSTLPPVFLVEGKAQDGMEIVKAAFAAVRRGFGGAIHSFRPGRLCGFVTDSPYANGMAWCIHPGEPVYGLSVTAGSLLETVVAAYRVLSVPGLDAALPMEGTLEATMEWPRLETFLIPGSQQRRDRGVRYAHCGFLAVFMHEFAHVVRGHLGYEMATRGSLYMDERPLQPAAVDTQMRLYIESDADEMAGRFLATWLLRSQPDGRPMDEAQKLSIAFDFLVGTTLAFSAFPRVQNLYHTGTLRARVLMGAMLHWGGIEGSRADQWIESNMRDVLLCMQAAGYPAESYLYSAAEAKELMTSTWSGIRRHQQDWIRCAPFKQVKPRVTLPE
ncbi:hypothetical protein ABH900_000266 [Stenotrophomonas sp. AN71]|uniref:hypothetical protein n=1 Tax=Stenotrophomonas sp. AN71 TaxID=3156253 RepID=UPI003D1B0CBF